MKCVPWACHRDTHTQYRISMPTGGALGALGQDTRERHCSHPLRGRSSRMPCFVVPSCPSSPRLLYACLVLAWRAGAWQPGSHPSFLPALQSSLRSAAPTPAAWGLLRAGLSQRCGKPPLARARPAACTTHASPFARLSLPSLSPPPFSLSPPLPPSIPPSLSLHAHSRKFTNYESTTTFGWPWDYAS